MKQRHLGTIRSNLDNGWQPSSYSNNQQLKFDDYKFHDGNKSTTLDDFYSYSGTLNTFNPGNQNIFNNYNQGFSKNPKEQDAYQPNQLETAQKKHNEISSWDSLIAGGYNMGQSDIKYYNDLVNDPYGYKKTFKRANPQTLWI